MNYRIIISGGGTGGHIFPALAIANEFKRRWPSSDILFVGAKGGMETELVPRNGYPIKTVWISGIHRKISLKNILRNTSFPLKLGVSLIQARRILKDFKPDFVIGTGGFASGPMGRVAQTAGVPLFICEQNAFPGLVNRWLAKGAKKIMLGNGAAKKYFPNLPTVETGNPIRHMQLLPKAEAARLMELSPQPPTLLAVGGSLGAGSINEALLANLDKILEAQVQLIWQCGKRYYETLKPKVPEQKRIKLMPFIENMAAAYSMADLVISRAGGSTLSELIDLSKPSVMVPSPNVAEDHQTQNALSLSENGAAVLVKDGDAKDKLVDEALAHLLDEQKLTELTQNITAMPKYNAAERIVEEIIQSIP